MHRAGTIIQLIVNRKFERIEVIALAMLAFLCYCTIIDINARYIDVSAANHNTQIVPCTLYPVRGTGTILVGVHMYIV